MQGAAYAYARGFSRGERGALILSKSSMQSHFPRYTIDVWLINGIVKSRGRYASDSPPAFVMDARFVFVRLKFHLMLCPRT